MLATNHARRRAGLRTIARSAKLAACQTAARHGEASHRIAGQKPAGPTVEFEVNRVSMMGLSRSKTEAAARHGDVRFTPETGLASRL